MMAERTGLEPATSGVTGRHSNQLNYRSTKSLCWGLPPQRGVNITSDHRFSQPFF